VTLTPAVAKAEDGVVPVASFDAGMQHWPEGLTIDKKGNMYVTQGSPFWYLPSDGWIKKISPDGTEAEELAFFEDGQGPAGIVVNARGDIYFAWPNPFDLTKNGVYQLHDDGTAERLEGTQNIILANGLAFDYNDDLFVSDSLGGAIWRIPTDGSGPAQLWSFDASLAGCGDVGANGVAIWEDSVYVANTLQGLLVRIPILEDGSAGQPEVVAGDDTNGCDFDDLWGIDGIALDVHGNVYALLVLQDKLVRIDPSDGSYEVLLTATDGLHNPASIAFGTGKGERQSVFITNFALFPPGPDSLGPAVLKYDVGVPGLPIPQTD
jgi:sugar lactone lactonase YvrE